MPRYQHVFPEWIGQQTKSSAIVVCHNESFYKVGLKQTPHSLYKHPTAFVFVLHCLGQTVSMITPKRLKFHLPKIAEAL